MKPQQSYAKILKQCAKYFQHCSFYLLNIFRFLYLYQVTYKIKTAFLSFWVTVHITHCQRNIKKSTSHKMKLCLFVVLAVMTEAGIVGSYISGTYEATENLSFQSASRTIDLNCGNGEKEICHIETKCHPRSTLRCQNKTISGSLRQVCRLETDTKCRHVPSCHSVVQKCQWNQISTKCDLIGFK